ncbi:MAG: hypothetical protein ACR2RB_07680, partial [Gammaproteobacteria bacterium]
YTATVERRSYSTATWNPNRKSQLAQGTSFTRISESQPLRFFAIPFHIATYLLFNGRLAELFQATIKKKMIAPTRSAPIVLTRVLKMEKQTCVIEDQVRPPRGGLPIDDLQVTETVTMHSPSARNDLARSFRLSDSARDTAVGLLRNGDTVLIVWKVPIEAAPAGAIDHSAERIDD